VNLHLLVLLIAGAAGAGVGRLLRLPMWPITGALLGSALANVLQGDAVTMPAPLSFVAQVLVGTAVGASVLPGFFAMLGRLIVPAAIVALALVATGVSCGLVLSSLGLMGRPESLLGMVPGGVGEMVAASSVVGADSALVAGIHVVRLLVTLWILPLLVRWALTWKRSGGSGETTPEP